MTDDRYATQRELDMLRDQVASLQRDLQSVDAGVGRGVPVLQSQLTDLVKDVTELRTNVDNRFTAHEAAHRQADRDRVSGRRWLIGTAFAGIGALGGLYAMIFDLLTRH